MTMITTTRGYLMESESLRRETGVIENDNERTAWVEYWDGDEMVHRSAHVTIKKGLILEPIGGQIG